MAVEPLITSGTRKTGSKSRRNDTVYRKTVQNRAGNELFTARGFNSAPEMNCLPQDGSIPGRKRTIYRKTVQFRRNIAPVFLAPGSQKSSHDCELRGAKIGVFLPKSPFIGQIKFLTK